MIKLFVVLATKLNLYDDSVCTILPVVDWWCVYAKAINAFAHQAIRVHKIFPSFLGNCVTNYHYLSFSIFFSFSLCGHCAIIISVSLLPQVAFIRFIAFVLQNVHSAVQFAISSQPNDCRCYAFIHLKWL